MKTFTADRTACHRAWLSQAARSFFGLSLM
jgi:hypothetical protein